MHNAVKTKHLLLVSLLTSIHIYRFKYLSIDLSTKLNIQGLH